jgi:hypothetical protein
LVADIDQCLGGAAIYKLRAKQRFRLRESGFDLDLEVARAKLRRVGIVLRDVVFINFNNLGLLMLNQYAAGRWVKLSCKLYLNVWVVSIEDLTDDAADGQQGHSE